MDSDVFSFAGFGVTITKVSSLDNGLPFPALEKPRIRPVRHSDEDSGGS